MLRPRPPLVAPERLGEIGGWRAASRFRRAHLGFVFQQFNLLRDLTAGENIELSAGEQQRVAIAGVERIEGLPRS